MPHIERSLSTWIGHTSQQIAKMTSLLGWKFLYVRESGLRGIHIKLHYQKFIIQPSALDLLLIEKLSSLADLYIKKNQIPFHLKRYFSNIEYKKNFLYFFNKNFFLVILSKFSYIRNTIRLTQSFFIPLLFGSFW